MRKLLDALRLLFLPRCWKYISERHIRTLRALPCMRTSCMYKYVGLHRVKVHIKIVLQNWKWYSLEGEGDGQTGQKSLPMFGQHLRCFKDLLQFIVTCVLRNLRCLKCWTLKYTPRLGGNSYLLMSVMKMIISWADILDYVIGYIAKHKQQVIWPP
jgi:hypothetical protein